MNAVNLLCSIAEEPAGQTLEVDCTGVLSYRGAVIDSDTDPDDIHGRDAATLTIKTEDGETVRLIFRDNGSHTSNPTSLYAETESGMTYGINSIEEV